MYNIFCRRTNTLVNRLNFYVGRVITVFVVGGSGQGFTGILAFVSPCYIKLVTSFASPPKYPLLNFDNKNPNYSYNNVLGSITEICTSSIIAFTYNTL